MGGRRHVDRRQRIWDRVALLNWNDLAPHGIHAKIGAESDPRLSLIRALYGLACDVQTF